MASHDDTGGEKSIEPVRALDARYYTDAGAFERDKQRILFRTWQYAGHVSQVEKPGDFFAFSVCDQNLFTVRGADRVVRGFFNVCMHRAHQLVQDSGNKRVLVCPYHSWTYELDGRLRKAPDDEKVPGFDRKKIYLTEVRTEILCGFIFVNLDAHARPWKKITYVIDDKDNEHATQYRSWFLWPTFSFQVYPGYGVNSEHSIRAIHEWILDAHGQSPRGDAVS